MAITKTALRITFAGLLAIAATATASKPSTTVQLIDNATEAEGCELVTSIKGKGKTETQVRNDLKEKAWWHRADTVLITGKTKKGLRGEAYRCREVRITSNPEVIRGCEYLENIEIYNSFSSMLGTNNPVKPSDLADKAWLIGADAIMVIDTDNNSGSAEAYYCGKPHAAND